MEPVGDRYPSPSRESHCSRSLSNSAIGMSTLSRPSQSKVRLRDSPDRAQSKGRDRDYDVHQLGQVDEILNRFLRTQKFGRGQHTEQSLSGRIHSTFETQPNEQVQLQTLSSARRKIRNPTTTSPHSNRKSSAHSNTRKGSD